MGKKRPAPEPEPFICPFCMSQDCVVPFPQDTPCYIREAFPWNVEGLASCEGGQAYQKRSTGYCLADIPRLTESWRRATGHLTAAMIREVVDRAKAIDAGLRDGTVRAPNLIGPEETLLMEDNHEHSRPS